MQCGTDDGRGGDMKSVDFMGLPGFRKEKRGFFVFLFGNMLKE